MMSTTPIIPHLIFRCRIVGGVSSELSPEGGETGGSGVDDVYHRSGFFAADHDEAQATQAEVR